MDEYDPSRQTVGKPLRVIVCDTDALTQIFCSKHESILKHLHTQYGIDFAVTEAVEAEVLRPNRKQAGCSQDGFRKALDLGLIAVLSPRTLGRFTSNNPYVTYDSIELRGQEYNRVIDLGEAYTHAAAHVLKCAVLSNDWKAIRDCDRMGLNLAHPTFRVYDLVVLLYQSGGLTEKECDGFRKALHEAGETPHRTFVNRKFRDGLPGFYPRLVNPDFEVVGSAIETELGDQHRVQLKKPSGA
jgi:hypothetical protein